MKSDCKSFENIIKNIILLEFEKKLPKDKRNYIKNFNISDSGLKFDEKDFQCQMIRYIFSVLIDVKCEKNFDIKGTERTIEYGNFLNIGFIEYFTFWICEKYSIEYVKDDDSLESFKYVKKISSKIDLRNLVFDKNAIEILDIIGEEKLISDADNDAIKVFLKTEENDNINYNFSDNNSLVYIFYKNGKLTGRFYDKYVFDIELDSEYDEGTFLIYLDLFNKENLKLSTFISKLERMSVPYKIIKIKKIVTKTDIISVEEYEKLCEKAIKEDLSSDELKKLKAYDDFYSRNDNVNNKDINIDNKDDNNISLKESEDLSEKIIEEETKDEENDINNIVNKYISDEISDNDINKIYKKDAPKKMSFIKKCLLVIYICLMTVCIGIILGVILIKLNS